MVVELLLAVVNSRGAAPKYLSHRLQTTHCHLLEPFRISKQFPDYCPKCPIREIWGSNYIFAEHGWENTRMHIHNIVYIIVNECYLS